MIRSVKSVVMTPDRGMKPAAVPECPRCHSDEVTGTKTTLPSRNADGSPRVAHEFYCKSCKLLEDGVEGEPGYEEFRKRWDGATKPK